MIFSFRPANKNDIDKVVFQNNKADPPGCWSYVGRIGGIQKIQLSGPRCYKKDAITHEIIHAIGHYHEHNRPDRDQHIKVNFKCISNIAKKSYEKQNITDTYGLPYDHYSIMHYNRWQGAVHSNCKTMTSMDSKVADDDLGSSKEMTELDVKKILAMQHCTVPCK